ncbi:uncharacterized protein CTRU02_200644 [Colletotrichum truncatum]|uniref:Uncharacterized protein n=1 Tax=Colletotrichum truncatum TaxID=5467 RepID=A0ACC3ZF56_COLTU|nr:uncharacterized protein CTRU02_00407 [Colletotrichum truncatum]KAF6801658.1 hypothetical protein CTRU02_00407 [Colletotrichum truncatum]
MTSIKLITLVASVVFTGANAACASTTIAPPKPTATAPCVSPNAMCGVEAAWSGGAFGYKEDLATPEQCLEFCNAKRTWGECVAFSFSDIGRCWIHNIPASEVTVARPGSGYWIWDKECWECAELGPISDVPTRTTSATTATETCLSPTAKCEIEASFVGDGDVRSWGTYHGFPGGDDGPFGCWEVCTDARRPPRCKSFSWNPVTGICQFYNFTFDQSHAPAPGSGLWAWDIDCWTCGVSGYM